MDYLLLLVPAALALFSPAYAAGARWVSSDARTTGLVSLRVGSWALSAGALFLLLGAFVFEGGSVARPLELNLFGQLVSPWAAMAFAVAGVVAVVALGATALAIGMYWEYGRVVAWGRSLRGSRRWLVLELMPGPREALPPVDQAAIPRMRGVVFGAAILLGETVALLTDSFVRTSLLAGYGALVAIVAAPALAGLALLILALSRGDRRKAGREAPFGCGGQPSTSEPDPLPPQPQPSSLGPLSPAAWSAGVLLAIGVIAIIAAVVVPVLHRWLSHR